MSYGQNTSSCDPLKHDTGIVNGQKHDGSSNQYLHDMIFEISSELFSPD